jgi:hypothetical protein
LPTWWPPVRERLLTRHFLQRFLENDLLSPDADRHDAIALVCGALLSVGLFISILSPMKFLFMPFQSPGRTLVLAMGDRMLFVSLAMIVMSLVAVLTWDSLSLDPRDTAIFGPLPIRRGVIVRAKLRAVGILAATFAVALGSLSSVFHPSLMVAKLPIGLFAALALILIQFAVTLSAGFFAFGSVVLIREVLRAALGMRFSRVSAGLQAVLIVALVTSFLLLPAILQRAGRPDRLAARLLPPVWFVGLHDALAGDLVAGLRPGALPPAVARQEERAMARYRELASQIRPLAWRAVAGLTLTFTVSIAAFFWNSRRLPLPLVGNRGRRYGGLGLVPRVIMFTLARRPATQAGFFFTLQCLFRSGPHRVVMAACTAVSIAIATVFLAATSRTSGGDPSGVPGYVLSTQMIALAVLLAGFRHASRLPADISANRLFRMAWVADSGRFLAGVRRGALIGVVAPAIVLLLPPYIYLMGTRLALMHALTGFLVSAALISLMTFKPTQLPFVASYAPSGDLNTFGPVVLVGGMIAISVFSSIERFALGDMQSALILWGILAAAAVLPQFAAGHNAQLDLPTAFDVPAQGTTRLDLG